MDWQKVGQAITTIGVIMGLLLQLTLGAWYASQLFYRVTVVEAKVIQLELRETDNQKLIADAVNTEAKIGQKLDDLTDLLKIISDHEDAPSKPNHN